jgi:integrase
MASLQARHQRSCPLYPWTPFAKATKTNGCTCVPLYHVVHRHNGELVREPVGHNRREAERALDGRRGDIARRAYRILDDISFDEWADRWLAGFTGKENTRRVYQDTLDYAKRTFRRTKVRDLDPADVRRFLDEIRDGTLARRNRHRKPDDPPAATASPATLAKHLRTLGACLQAAVVEGYASENPVRRLHKTARPKVAKGRPAYYTDDELARLWPEIADRPLMTALLKTAVATGLRFGELAALRWTDVDLLNRELHVRRTHVDGIGEQSPKSGEARTIDLTPPAAAVLEKWYTLTGDDGLVFEREEGGYLTSDHVRRSVLYPALVRAGVARVGESGRKRDLHSFRHTFARIALEGGAEITWVKEQLGHSSITLTVDLYGHWSRASKKAQAERLADAFVL